MRPTIPNVAVPGDKANRIMACCGSIVGYSPTRIVWRFGYRPDSPSAAAHKCHVTGDGFLFVLANTRGTVLDQFQGFACDLPARFRKVADAKCGH